jgi:predicted S18 family serine protease
MKKFTKVLLILFIAAAVLLAAACAKPPAEEMNNAIDAVTRAENDADAVTYAGNTLLRARDALTRMQEEANSKRYDAAKSLATEAVAAAEKAIADGKSGAARARDDAANLLKGLPSSIAETEGALNNAKRVQNINLNANGLEEELQSAKNTFDNAQRSFNAGNYRDASSQGQMVRSSLENIKGRIAEAAQTVTRKK